MAGLGHVIGRRRTGYLPGGETALLEVCVNPRPLLAPRARHPQVDATIEMCGVLKATWPRCSSPSAFLLCCWSVLNCAAPPQVPTEAEIQELYTALELDAPDEPARGADEDSSAPDSFAADGGRSVCYLTVSFVATSGSGVGSACSHSRPRLRSTFRPGHARASCLTCVIAASHVAIE